MPHIGHEFPDTFENRVKYGRPRGSRQLDLDPDDNCQSPAGYCGNEVCTPTE